MRDYACPYSGLSCQPTILDSVPVGGPQKASLWCQSITPYGQRVESVCEDSQHLTSHSFESVAEVRYGSKKRPLLLPTPNRVAEATNPWKGTGIQGYRKEIESLHLPIDCRQALSVLFSIFVCRCQAQ